MEREEGIEGEGGIEKSERWKRGGGMKGEQKGREMTRVYNDALLNFCLCNLERASFLVLCVYTWYSHMAPPYKEPLLPTKDLHHMAPPYESPLNLMGPLGPPPPPPTLLQSLLVSYMRRLCLCVGGGGGGYSRTIGGGGGGGGIVGPLGGGGV